jgi:hypothetical protein
MSPSAVTGWFFVFAKNKIPIMLLLHLFKPSLRSLHITNRYNVYIIRRWNRYFSKSPNTEFVNCSCFLCLISHDTADKLLKVTLSEDEIDTFRRAQILSSLIVRAFLCLISHDTADKLLKVTLLEDEIDTFRRAQILSSLIVRVSSVW